jgi:hypothetical protein
VIDPEEKRQSKHHEIGHPRHSEWRQRAVGNPPAQEHQRVVPDEQQQAQEAGRSWPWPSHEDKCKHGENEWCRHERDACVIREAKEPCLG